MTDLVKCDGMEATPPRPLTALEAQSLTTDALHMILIARIALLEATNPMHDREAEAFSLTYGASKLLAECEAKISAVDDWLDDA